MYNSSNVIMELLSYGCKVHTYTMKHLLTEQIDVFRCSGLIDIKSVRSIKFDFVCPDSNDL